MTRFVVALLVGGLCTATSFGVTPDPKDLIIPPSEITKARDLIRKLGSELYREREEAHAELVKMGRLARPALLEAAATDLDPEIRFRTSRLLPKAGADELTARLDTFLADKEGKFDHDLPGMKQFRKVVGQDEKARALFVEIIKSPYNVEVLQAIDRGVTEAGRAIADRRTLLFTHLQHRNVGGRMMPPQPIAIADIACLLFAESVTPSKEIPRGMWNHITGATFLQQGASNSTLTNASAPHSDPYRRIVGQWLETREDVQDLNQLAHMVGQQHFKSFPQSLPLLRRIVTTDGVYGYAKGQALMFLMQQRPKEEMGFLKTLLTNDTLVSTVWFGNNINPANPQPQQHQCLLRDVALALLITQNGQKLKEYGYSFPNGHVEPNAQNIGYGNNYAFTTDEARAAAMVKFGFWQLKQSFKEPVVEPVKEPAPPVPAPAPSK
ncbi:MAG: hypothetical protein K8U57_23270 [Planctomycetes bacterium]|nr:hypothetical protein [Planctomycetota bacterium]